MRVSHKSDGRPHPVPGLPHDRNSLPIVIATILREEGITGVHSYVNRLREYLMKHEVAASLVTPFSFGGPLTGPVFGLRLLLKRFSSTASAVWYRYWHEAFLYNALRQYLARIGDCIVYAQDPLAARAALRARQGPHQSVVLAVHFRISMADEWADKKEIKRDRRVFRGIRQFEREVIPRVDGLVYVSQWAQDALLHWLPEASLVPSAVIGCMVTPLPDKPAEKLSADLVTVGNLDIVKNHRFLLTVLAEANRIGRKLTLDVFGEGPLRKDLQQLTHSLGLAEQVRFLGFLPNVRASLAGYRAYVHACYSESFCLAIVEAMAAGLPVLAGDIGPIAELYDDGLEGIFWPLDDPARAADLLLDLLADEQARLKSARAAKERFHREFQPDIVVPRLLSFLAEVAAGTPVAASLPLDSPVLP